MTEWNIELLVEPHMMVLTQTELLGKMPLVTEVQRARDLENVPGMVFDLLERHGGVCRHIENGVSKTLSLPIHIKVLEPQDGADGIHVVIGILDFKFFRIVGVNLAITECVESPDHIAYQNSLHSCVYRIPCGPHVIRRFPSAARPRADTTSVDRGQLLSDAPGAF